MIIFQDAQAIAATSDDDAELICCTRANVLLIGPDETCGTMIDTVRAGLQQPVVTWRRAERLLLPPPETVGTLILRGIDALEGNDQQHVFDWVGAPAAPRVISTGAASLLALLEGGTFSRALYYRLNIVCILKDGPA